MHRIIATIVVVFITSVAHAATLEIPGPNTTQSGIGVVSGWKCRANGRLTVRFDGGSTIPLVYGSERTDTRSVCRDTNNGFVAIWNWGNLDDGRHTAVVYDNGVEFDRATFTVVTTGVEFLRGVTGSGTATLSNGQRATLRWSEASQGFVVTDFTAPGGGGNDLNDLLGTWRFTGNLGPQPYNFSYRLERIDTSTGTPLITGTDLSDSVSVIVAGRIRDVDATSTLPYEYALLDVEPTICGFFVFNKTGSNRVSGRLFLFEVNAGSCTTTVFGSSNGYTFTGTRTSQAIEGMSEKTPASSETLAQGIENRSLFIPDENEEEAEAFTDHEDVMDMMDAIDSLRFELDVE